MWSYIFGGSTAGRGKQKDLPKKAIVELREHINLLNKKQTHLNTQINQQVLDAKTFLNKGNKIQAKNSLKKKKIYEAQLDKLENTINSLEQQLFSIESANLNLETMKAMKQGSQAMKAIHNGLNIDKVDETMDDIREQVELGDEISEAIARPLYVGGMNGIMDDEDLDEELDLLQQETEANNMMSEPVIRQEVKETKMDLPNVPSEKLKSLSISESNHQEESLHEEEDEDEDERALRELQAEMGL
ncbi:hypothetical protein TPHA_0G02270 [Tetrapisispora phaffii CBS 4417]|uniref:Vacuolar-sorting protein SNF7 n=1 Tax=Tetrapisispora phaffii (strain ATCC 24235 / CBS 4417 / NBRC 1672 / NRRL Y-8282 / UCD 70-5) TaxID=1071381 RepID=G8BVY5_TETPH|nr:hypothetical protein TPHA_0G02270 [Tetrapisispora phaffii CBS 4417]CCE64063.1 hypothetical protein TPHA_0G02270 [Tetrapisispora phaffii CBS 4417]